ncbi:hypothetical protein [Oleiagrimonas sp. C23AA]|uniref:hypothetical protein n=1 Tax=Oleiagrimonas sp. C23AA TaxID=2719047 RepID=UPI00142430C5|nr:hypothetical protein [Oleiagrimonas sp. C23AA]NII11152.1 hypothetical protein [Oleiagrimonas sp. C23AA]
MGSDAGHRVADMLGRQHDDGRLATQRDVPGGSIGCLGAAMPAQGHVCFFVGQPIRGPAVQNIVDADAAARLFPQYDGAFAGVFWDAERQWLVVVTDCLGMQPLYMRHVNGELTLSSQTRALRGDPDFAAWGAFLSLGHPIGARSLMQGLVRVPAASIVTFDVRRGTLDIRRYWQWPDPSDAWRGYDFLGSLEQDVRAGAAYGDPGTLLLSGGVDSRLLLFLLKRSVVPAQALIVAHQDEANDADGRLAQAVAKLAGMRFRRVYPATDFFSSQAYIDYLQASDVGFPSMELFIAKVASHLHGTAVWDGLVPGFVFMPLHQPEGGFKAYLREEVRGAGSAIWRAAKRLFRDEVYEAMREGFADDLRREVSHLSQDAYGLARFVIENRSRNRASMNPLKVYASQGDAFTPGLSKDFMAHAAIIPFEVKQRGHLYRQLLQKLDRRSLAVPFISGGELMPGRVPSLAYGVERLRQHYFQQRARHPRLFPKAGAYKVERSCFLGELLLQEDDAWLHEQVRERLRESGPDIEVAWKLLFHWKAWQWLHQDGLARVLPGAS